MIVCALALLLWFAYGAMKVDAGEQGAAAMREAILDSARQCAAVEGSYPSSLQYLEQSYGLSVNHQDFIITYEAFAGNVAPSVVVVPR